MWTVIVRDDDGKESTVALSEEWQAICLAEGYNKLHGAGSVLAVVEEARSVDNITRQTYTLTFITDETVTLHPHEARRALEATLDAMRAKYGNTGWAIDIKEQS